MKTVILKYYSSDEGPINIGYPCVADFRSYEFSPSYIHSRSVRRIVTGRWLVQNKDLLVEVWDEYNPTRSRRWGKPRSVLRSRFVLRKFKSETTGNKIKWLRVGTLKCWNFRGEREELAYFNDEGALLKRVSFDADGKLMRYADSSRGVDNTRVVQLSRYNNEITIQRWRGRYHDRIQGEVRRGWTTRNRSIDYTILKSENGLPLSDRGDYVERCYSLEGKLISEVKCVAGQRHGVRTIYNRFGRKIDEEYYYHGTEVPGWMYRKPEDVTVEEVLGEENLEVRRAIMELQGFELFMSRAKSKGIVEVVDEDKDERVGTLLKITLGETSDRPDDTNTVMLLRVKDGTLPKHYVLRVPMEMKTARQANAWTWGLEEKDYAPAIER